MNSVVMDLPKCLHVFFTIRKKASTDSKILASNPTTLTLTQWYDNDTVNSSLHGSQVLSEASGHSHDVVGCSVYAMIIQIDVL